MKSIFMKRKSLAFLGLVCALIVAGCATSQTQKAGLKPAVDVSIYPTNSAGLPGKGPYQSWDGFKKVWAQRHAEWKQTKAADKGAVVFLGDSITQGWRSLSNDFSNLHVANRGISGDTTCGVWFRLDDDVIDLSPEAVVLLIGTNDIGLGADPADVADNIRHILQALRKSNHRMPIILCHVMPRADRNLHAEGKIMKLNSLLDEIAKSVRGVTVCDTWSMYADANGDCSRAEFPDLLHPNAIGYAKWVAALNPIFAQLKVN